MAVLPVCNVLEHGMVPLVYGDVAFDEGQGCTIVSTEQVLAYLAREIPGCATWGREIGTRRMVMVGEVDGVHDRDPLQDPDATRIPHITPDSFAQLKGKLGGSHAVDVTGGMLTKVEAIVSLVAQGEVDRVHLVSGLRLGALLCVLLESGESGGTLIAGSSEPEVRERN
jgi:isopentenyl phosphate kinase